MGILVAECAARLGVIWLVWRGRLETHEVCGARQRICESTPVGNSHTFLGVPNLWDLMSDDLRRS